jgi:hypothetical protein
MALLFHHARPRRVVRGVARYEQDPVLGAVLRICSASKPASPPDDFEIILQEETWEGDIVPDQQFDCDFCIAIFAQEGTPE